MEKFTQSYWARGALIVVAVFALVVLGQAQQETRKIKKAKVFTVDPRGEPELTVCSQNLQQYKVEPDKRSLIGVVTPLDMIERERALVKRFVDAKCDVIAVQEILAKSEEAAELALRHLSNQLKKRTNRSYDVRSGPSNDHMLRLGFIVATDRADVVNVTSYVKTELPRTEKRQRARYFPRGPLEIQLDVKPNGEASFKKTVNLVNLHFKSKAGKVADPTGLEWETYRIEMAEAIRRIVERRHTSSFTSGETLLVLLGDRNANFDVATAKVLEGSITLGHFQGESPACRLSKRGVPVCRPGSTRPQRLFSALTADPQTKLLPGTFMFKGVYSWLDDILMPAETLRFATARADSSGDWTSGVVYDPGDASDHALVWTTFNW